jgi:hypothetical protein
MLLMLKDMLKSSNTPGGRAAALLGVALVVTGILSYWPHFDYVYPLHVDEWRHIGEARKLLNGQYGFWSLAGFESGYHIFLAGLSLFGFDLITSYRFLPPVFALASAIALHAFTFHLTRSRRVSLLAVLFFAALPSNVNLLGLWFATPLTMAIPFIYLCMLLMHRGLNEGDARIILAFVLAFAGLLVIHPVSAFFVAAVAVLYAAVNRRFIKVSRKAINIMLVATAGIIIIGSSYLAVMLGLVKMSPAYVLSYLLKQLVFAKGWTPLEPSTTVNSILLGPPWFRFSSSPFFIPLLFGVIPFALAFIGLYAALCNRRLSVLAVWVLYSSAAAFLFVNLQVSPLIPYQRMLYYCLLGMAPLSAVGLDMLLGRLEESLGPSRLMGALLVLLVLAASFIGYGAQPPGLELYRLVSDDDYLALKFLDKQRPGKVMAPLEIGSAMPALTSQQPFAALVFLGNRSKRDTVDVFFRSDCAKKEEILSSNWLRYVYSLNPIECGNMSLIYSNGRYIYSRG